ncbi:MAG: hypothetical protein H6Q74_1827 [Firmicutes bacterium]|nr:hypothetical protein [Bacillota bacterium]
MKKFGYIAITPCTWLVVVSVVAAVIGSRVLPNVWGAENGPLEVTQAIILLCTCLVALSSRYYGVGTLAQRKLWVWTMPVWLLMSGRELSWGRVFYTNQAGDIVQLSDLWYGAYVHPTVAVIVMLTIWGLVKTGVISQMMNWLKYGGIPLVEVVVMLIAIVIAGFVEHGSGGMFGVREELYEELAEWVSYITAFFLMIELGFNKKIQPSQEARKYKRLTNYVAR